MENGSITNKIVKFFAILFLVLFVGYFLIVGSTWGFIGLVSLRYPNPAEPEIKYAEFPFELVYEINGETRIVNDTYVCEYMGIFGNTKKHRMWMGHIKSTDDSSILLIEDMERKIYCSVGNAAYYMGDDDGYSKNEPVTPYLYEERKIWDDTMSLSAQDIAEQYDIALISWELSEPIENNFVRENIFKKAWPYILLAGIGCAAMAYSTYKQMKKES